jgi:hypothetical protein
VPSYKIVGSDGSIYYTSANSLTVTGVIGETITYTVYAVNPNDNTVVGPASGSAPIAFLSSSGDEDGDGENNADEDVAGTNPFDAVSVFRIVEVTRPGVSSITVTWSSVAGKVYQVEKASSPVGTYAPVGPAQTATVATSSFTDTSGGPAPQFFRVRIVP